MTTNKQTAAEVYEADAVAVSFLLKEINDRFHNMPAPGSDEPITWMNVATMGHLRDLFAEVEETMRVTHNL